MKNQQIKFKKIITSFGFFSLIFISNNGEISAKYNTSKNNFMNKNNNFEINYSNYEFQFKNNNLNDFQNIQIALDQPQIAQNDENENSNVLISEIGRMYLITPTTSLIS